MPPIPSVRDSTYELVTAAERCRISENENRKGEALVLPFFVMIAKIASLPELTAPALISAHCPTPHQCLPAFKKSVTMGTMISILSINVT
jgi:hypothetical protein